MTPTLLPGSEVVIYVCALAHRHIFREKAERCDRVASRATLWTRPLTPPNPTVRQ